MCAWKLHTQNAHESKVTAMKSAHNHICTVEMHEKQLDEQISYLDRKRIQPIFVLFTLHLVFKYAVVFR